MPIIPPRKKALAIAFKSNANTEIKTFLSCPNLFDFFTLFIAMNFDIVLGLAVIAVEQYSSDWGSQNDSKRLQIDAQRQIAIKVTLVSLKFLRLFLRFSFCQRVY